MCKNSPENSTGPIVVVVTVRTIEELTRPKAFSFGPVQSETLTPDRLKAYQYLLENNMVFMEEAEYLDHIQVACELAKARGEVLEQKFEVFAELTTYERVALKKYEQNIKDGIEVAFDQLPILRKGDHIRHKTLNVYTCSSQDRAQLEVLGLTFMGGNRDLEGDIEIYLALNNIVDPEGGAHLNEDFIYRYVKATMLAERNSITIYKRSIN